MRYKLHISLVSALALCVSVAPAQARFGVLYSFAGQGDGANPQASLIRDKAGNLYGTTFEGGAHGMGTVFRLAPDGTESVLHAFAGGSDGAYPAANVIMDKQGDLYGTTLEGGGTHCGGRGCGTVFEIASDGIESVLHAFKGGNKDGAQPFWGLIQDRAGNLYGTTTYGPGTGCALDQGCGTVFELAPGGAETVLHAFKGGSEAGNPNGNLVQDKAGNLYGAALWGGASNDGAIFKLTPAGTETVLYDFTPDANSPAGLSADDDGNLYTTVQGGKHGYGAVFKLAPDGAGSLLYSFRGGRDGDGALSGVILDAAKNVYGTTSYGGGQGCQGNGCGTVFAITPQGDETVLHTFKATGFGVTPAAGLVLDRAGHLYGTTNQGGTQGFGTVFRLSH